jgi:signal peptidase I
MKKLKEFNMIGLILNILITIISILTILGIYYMIQIKILKKDYANIYGYTFFEVATGSMADTINIGDVVIVKINDEIQENDIIVYKEENSFITHRIIEINEESIITRGDANNSEDKPIQANQILGKVVYNIPQIGTWRRILATPDVIGMIFGIIIILIIMYIKTSKSEEKDE